MSKYVEDEQYSDYMANTKRKYNKGDNSKISLILKRLDNIDTILIRLLRAFHMPAYVEALGPDEISFEGDSSSDDELPDVPSPFLAKNY
jgi:hypothetical protein